MTSSDPRLGHEAAGLERSDVPKWWETEATAVLTAELADALVPDLVSSSGRIQAIHQHAFPRGLKPQHFLVLQRAHGRQSAELMMKRGDAHACCVGEFLYT